MLLPFLLDLAERIYPASKNLSLEADLILKCLLILICGR